MTVPLWLVVVIAAVALYVGVFIGLHFPSAPDLDEEE